MIVAKFGGTSMASHSSIRAAVEIMRANEARRVMVVSAPGKRFSDDSKVTDLLIELANATICGGDIVAPLDRVLGRYFEIIEGLGLDAELCRMVRDDLRARIVRTDLKRERFMDLMKAAGEDLCAKIVAAYLSKCGVRARYVNPNEAGMILSDKAGNASILPDSYARLSLLKNEEGILVFPGFFGYTNGGEVVTFSRGGSDVTGSILAAALGADVYENYTDVDHIYAANPKIIDSPEAVDELTYNQMRELSYAGFSVFHEAAVEPVVRARIPIHIKNTFNASAKGTRIVHSRDITSKDVLAIAGTGGFLDLTISKYMMNSEIGFGRRLFQILEEEGMSFDHAPSGIDNISPILRKEQLFGDKLARLTSRIREELNIDSIEVSDDLALMVIVCETVYSTKSVVARAVKSLTAKDIGITMLNMISNSLSLTIGVREKDLERALKTLYKEFF